jgi:hypothetical protein
MEIRTRQITSSEQLKKIPAKTEILFFQKGDRGNYLATETGLVCESNITNQNGIQFHIPGSGVYRHRRLQDFVFEGTSVKVKRLTQGEEWYERNGYNIYDIYEILKEENDNG